MDFSSSSCVMRLYFAWGNLSISWQGIRSKGLEPKSLLQHFGIEQPPVPVDDIIAKIENIKCDSLPTSKSARVIVRVMPDVADIWNRERQISSRHRLCLAWALGEILYEPIGVYQAGKFFGGPGLIFALDFLMPKRWTSLYLEHYRWDAEQVARVFDVDMDTLNLRIRYI